MQLTRILAKGSERGTNEKSKKPTERPHAIRRWDTRKKTTLQQSEQKKRDGKVKQILVVAD